MARLEVVMGSRLRGSDELYRLRGTGELLRLLRSDEFLPLRWNDGILPVIPSCPLKSHTTQPSFRHTPRKRGIQCANALSCQSNPSPLQQGANVPLGSRLRGNDELYRLRGTDELLRLRGSDEIVI